MAPEPTPVTFQQQLRRTLFPKQIMQIPSVHKIVAATAIAAATGASASCSAPPSPGAQAPAPLAYERPAPVTRAPLPPPAGYASASTSSLSTTDEGAAAQLGWRASPRWSAINGNNMLVVPDDPRTKFKAATKASKVEN